MAEVEHGFPDFFQGRGILPGLEVCVGHATAAGIEEHTRFIQKGFRDATGFTQRFGGLRCTVSGRFRPVFFLILGLAWFNGLGDFPGLPRAIHGYRKSPNKLQLPATTRAGKILVLLFTVFSPDR
jgi:hypothetical protein